MRGAFTFWCVSLFLLQLVGCMPLRTWAPGSDSLLQRSRDFLIRPFSEPDHVQLVQAVAAESVIQYRIRPAGTVTGKKVLSLTDCRKLALARSLELQMARFEEAAKQAIEQSNRLKMLPHLVGSGELSERDNQSYSYSEVLGAEGKIPPPVPNYQGNQEPGVTNYAVGRDRHALRWSVELRWSPTDTALAYYLTMNNRNDSRKQHYARVRMTQRLFGLVDGAFGRVLSLQEAVPIAQRLVDILRDSTAKTEKLFRANLVNPEDYYDRKKRLVRAERLLESLVTELHHQRSLLAGAMQISPDSRPDDGFCLEGELVATCLNEPIANLEMVAVRNRPEAYVAGLDYLSSVNDLRRTIVKFFPRVSGYWRKSGDQDRHLYHKDWKEIGLIASVDLLEWAANVAESRAARHLTEKAERGISAVALTITSEVRIAALKYMDAVQNVVLAQQALAASEQVLKAKQARAALDSLQKLAVADSQAEVLQERIEVIRALGQAQAAKADLETAMGTNYHEPLFR